MKEHKATRNIIDKDEQKRLLAYDLPAQALSSFEIIRLQMSLSSKFFSSTATPFTAKQVLASQRTDLDVSFLYNHLTQDF